MPKLRKEKTDEVVKLIEEGYTNTEIREKTGVSPGVIRRLRRERTPGEEPVEAGNEPVTGLSSESLTKIGHMQAMYGAASPDETVDKIFEDIRTMMQLKYRFDMDVEKTPGEVLSRVVEDKDVCRKSLENIFKARNSEFHQLGVFKIWGMDPAVKALYETIPPGSYPTIFDFMQAAVIGSFKENGYEVEYYWNDELEEKQPIITFPNGMVMKFPEGEITRK